jgi:hypothetical protein
MAVQSCVALLVCLAPATAIAGDVRLAWDPSPDATVVGYIIYYGPASGNYTDSVDVGNQTTYVIPNLSAGAPHYFIVRGYTADKQLSAPSNEVSGLPPFTDHPLIPGVHEMKWLHVSELQQRINNLRAAHGLGAYQWSSVYAGNQIRADHVTELRNALTDVYWAAGRPSPRFTDAAVSGRYTVIKAAHIMELRTALVALE